MLAPGAEPSTSWAGQAGWAHEQGQPPTPGLPVMAKGGPASSLLPGEPSSRRETLVPLELSPVGGQWRGGCWRLGLVMAGRGGPAGL